jgi:arylsulfatase A-like enzyme
MDISPTIVDIVGLPKLTTKGPIDGSSIRELFTVDLKIREKPIPFRHIGRAAIVDNNYKLISHDINKNEFELYDLVKDPNESSNIIEKEKEIAKQMIRGFKVWNQSVEASIKGDDYPNGLLESNGYNVFWNTVEEYQPYFEQWKNRPEYHDVLIKKN